MRQHFFLFLFFYFSLVNTCKDGCSSCDSTTSTCYVCRDPNLSRIQDGRCISISRAIDNCAVYSTENKCARCLPTYLLRNQVCVKDSTGCLVFEGEKCKKCGFGMSLENDKCVGIINCKQYEVDHRSCNNCGDGFLTFGVACYVGAGCVNTAENGACESCEPDYTLSGYMCVLKKFSLSPGCSVMNNKGACLYCWNGNEPSANGDCGGIQSSTLPVSVTTTTSQSVIPNTQPPTQPQSYQPQFQPQPQQQPQIVPPQPTIPQPTPIIQNPPPTQFTQNNQFNQIPQPPAAPVSNPQAKENCRFFDESINKCSSCNYNYFLRDGACIAVSPLCNGYNILTGQCLNCVDGYALGPNGVCSVKSPAQAAQISQPPTQIIQPTPIQQFPQSQPQPAPVSQQFTQQTQTQFYPPQPQQQPQQQPQPQRDPNCRSFSQLGSCLECFPSFSISPTTSLCTPQNAQCASYNGRGGCASCYQGYDIINDACVISRGDPNCKQAQNGVCTQCSTGFYLSSNKCVMVSPLCSTSNPTTGQCLSCYPGYALQNGQCRVFIQDANCKQYQNGNCIQCATNYVMQNGKCSLVSPLCSSFDQRTGSCLSCYHGYMLSNGQCIISNLFQNCAQVMNNQCVRCVGGFYLRTGTCYQASPLCASFDPNSGFCLTCYSGYSLANGECKVGTSISNCKTLQNNVCVECSSGYSMRNGGCVVVNPLCRTSDPSTGNCLTCYQGYTLQNGNCTIPTNSDPNCIQKSSNTCLTCANGYYLNNNLCTRLSKSCATYDMRSGNCTSCNVNYQVVNGDCLLTPKSADANCAVANSNSDCIQCYPNFYLSRVNGSCTAISMLCLTFDHNSQVCTQCQQGYFLQDGECIFPSMGLDPYCVHYSGSYCDRCRDGWRIVNYVCGR